MHLKPFVGATEKYNCFIIFEKITLASFPNLQVSLRDTFFRSQKDKENEGGFVLFCFNASSSYSKNLARNWLQVASVKLKKGKDKYVFSNLRILDLEGTIRTSCPVLAHLVHQGSPFLPHGKKSVQRWQNIVYVSPHHSLAGVWFFRK